MQNIFLVNSYISWYNNFLMKGGMNLNKKQINTIEEILASVGLESLIASAPKKVIKKIS